MWFCCLSVCCSNWDLIDIGCVFAMSRYVSGVYVEECGWNNSSLWNASFELIFCRCCKEYSTICSSIGIYYIHNRHYKINKNTAQYILSGCTLDTHADKDYTYTWNFIRYKSGKELVPHKHSTHLQNIEHIDKRNKLHSTTQTHYHRYYSIHTKAPRR